MWMWMTAQDRKLVAKLCRMASLKHEISGRSDRRCLEVLHHLTAPSVVCQIG